MSTQVKHRRGTAAENATFTGADGEIVSTTDTNRVALHDGAVAGGYTFPNAQDVQNNAMKYGTVGGTANAITLAHTIARTAHTAGAEIIFKPTANNTTAVTVAVDSIAGTKALEKMVSGTSTALSADDLRNGVVARAIYDGTRYQLQGSGGSVASVKSQVFTASGTYTPSAGMLYCVIELVGAGGGGGGGGNTGGTCGGGGGGGYSREVVTAATIGASQTVTIGAAGTAGAVNGGNGGNGGTTSVGSVISATGGNGGIGANNTNAKLGGTGGTGSSGDMNTTGQAGAMGWTATTPAGVGGSSFFGGGGVPGSSGAGGNGNYGGGGGGAGGLGAGGAGGAGVVFITEYCSQ